MASSINTVFLLPVTVEGMDIVWYAARGRIGRPRFEIGATMVSMCTMLRVGPEVGAQASGWGRCAGGRVARCLK